MSILPVPEIRREAEPTMRKTFVFLMFHLLFASKARCLVSRAMEKWRRMTCSDSATDDLVHVCRNILRKKKARRVFKALRQGCGMGTTESERATFRKLRSYYRRQYEEDLKCAKSGSIMATDSFSKVAW